jgi:hypothetical protein
MWINVFELVFLPVFVDEADPLVGSHVARSEGRFREEVLCLLQRRGCGQVSSAVQQRRDPANVVLKRGNVRLLI